MPTTSNIPVHHILHADDDDDDCFLFEEAMKQFESPYTLTTVRNGQELMELLNQEDYQLPDVLFLDLNMPRKNGFQCLEEIKSDQKLKTIPVIIFSTGYASKVVNELFETGAQYYIRKPSDFTGIKTKIFRGISMVKTEQDQEAGMAAFVL